MSADYVQLSDIGCVCVLVCVCVSVCNVCVPGVQVHDPMISSLV